MGAVVLVLGLASVLALIDVQEQRTIPGAKSPLAAIDQYLDARYSRDRDGLRRLAAPEYESAARIERLLQDSRTVPISVVEVVWHPSATGKDGRATLRAPDDNFAEEICLVRSGPRAARWFIVYSLHRR